jgi:hypothetical protein
VAADLRPAGPTPKILCKIVFKTAQARTWVAWRSRNHPIRGPYGRSSPAEKLDYHGSTGAQTTSERGGARDDRRKRLPGGGSQAIGPSLLDTLCSRREGKERSTFHLRDWKKKHTAGRPGAGEQITVETKRYLSPLAAAPAGRQARAGRGKRG